MSVPEGGGHCEVPLVGAVIASTDVGTCPGHARGALVGVLNIADHALDDKWCACEVPTTYEVVCEVMGACLSVCGYGHPDVDVSHEDVAIEGMSFPDPEIP